MSVITHDSLKITGIPFLATLLEIEIGIEPNEHGKMIIKGYGDPNETQEAIEKHFFGKTAELTQNGEPIFTGVITQCQTNTDLEVEIIEVTVTTGTILLDHEKKSRSFQNVTMTYSDVVEKVLKDTKGAAAIYAVGKETPIGKPLIQYEETDWTFIKRLASHFNSPIIPDAIKPTANIWFGIRQDGEEANFASTYYKVGVSDKYYEEDGMGHGLTPLDFAYKKVSDYGNYNIGDKAKINDVNLKICMKQAKLERSILEFTYTLGYDGLISVRKKYNEKIIGMSLTGTVMKTEAETVNIQLDIDGPKGGHEYPYDWTPTSGNLMYCMPKMGTKVTLLLPSEDEQEARSMNSPRDNGSKCADMDDYNNRAFTTEHNKKMYLYPGSMGFIATGSETTPLHIQLEDLEHMLFESHHEIMIVAEKNIDMEAPEVTFYSPIHIHVARTMKAEGFEALIIPIGTARTSGEDSEEEPEEDVLEPGDCTFLILHFRFDVKGTHGVFQGWEYVSFEPFDDGIEKGSRLKNLGKSLFRALVVAAVVAVVAVAVVATGGAALAAIGVKAAVFKGGALAAAKVAATGVVAKGVVGGAIMGSATVLIGDIKSGNVSSWRDYWTSATIGAVTGAFTGPLGAKVGGTFGAKIACTTSKIANKMVNRSLSVAGKRVVGAISGGVTGAITGGVSGFVTGGVTGGIDAIMRGIISGEGVTWADVRDGIRDGAIAGARSGFIMGGIFGCVSGAARGAKVSDPVNAVHGFVFYELVDFEYPGIIPLKWERGWCSKNTIIGHFGHASSFSYGVHIRQEEGYLAFVDKNGFGSFFECLEPGTKAIHRTGKMTLSYDGEKYEIFNHEELLYYIFEQKPESNIYHLKQIETDTREHKIVLQYNSKSNISSITDTAGREFNITTNETGQILQVRHNGKTLIKYDYDDFLDLVKITDVNGNSAHIVYDNHLMIKRTTFEGVSFIWEYTGQGPEAKCIHATGDNNLLNYRFEYTDNSTIVTNSLGYKETYHYTTDKTLTKITQENGHEIIYEHNEYSEITAITNADGETTTFAYNRYGLLTETVQPGGGKYAIEYDEQNRLIKTTTPLSAESEWAYDDIGRISQFVSPTGEVTVYAYNDKGLLAEIITGEGEAQTKTLLEYDNHLNIIAITYPNGAEERWEYDSEGNCVKAINPLGAVEKMDYDPANRLVRFASGDGNVTNLKYNAYNDIIWLKDNEREIRFTYSPLGSLTSRTEQHRKIEMLYDTEEQLVQVHNEAKEVYEFIRGPMGNVMEEIGYDDVRKLYAYTAAGKLKGIKRGNTSYWTRMKYGADGYLSKIIYDDGSDNCEEDVFTHGLMGELLTAENKHSKLKYEYDKLGNVIKETQNGHVIESTYSQSYENIRTNLKTSLGLNVDTALDKHGQAEGLPVFYFCKISGTNSIFSAGAVLLSIIK